MALQTRVMSNRVAIEGVSTEEASPYGLRNSCDQCYASKLRCSRDKPKCARCQKQRADCIYSPTKRPGRRRKVNNVAGSNTYVQDASGSTNQGLISLGMEEMMPDEREASAPSHEATQSNSSNSVIGSGSMVDDDNFQQFLGDLMSTGPPGLLDMDHSNVDSHSIIEEDWLTLESMGEEFELSGNSTGPRPSPQGLDQPGLSESSSWLPNSAQFSAESLSLKHWTSSSQSLQLVRNVSKQNMDDEQCLCYGAMANLQFHSKSASNIRPTAFLEIGSTSAKGSRLDQRSAEKMPKLSR